MDNYFTSIFEVFLKINLPGCHRNFSCKPVHPKAQHCCQAELACAAFSSLQSNSADKADLSRIKPQESRFIAV
jgi:hypothetical protein